MEVQKRRFIQCIICTLHLFEFVIDLERTFPIYLNRWCFAILCKKLGLPLKESTFLLSHFPRLVSSSRKTPLNCRTRHFHFHLNSEVTTKRPKMCFCVLNGTWKPKCVHRPHWIPIKIVSSLSCLPGKLIWSSSTTGSRA